MRQWLFYQKPKTKWSFSLACQKFATVVRGLGLALFSGFQGQAVKNPKRGAAGVGSCSGVLPSTLEGPATCWESAALSEQLPRRCFQMSFEAVLVAEKLLAAVFARASSLGCRVQHIHAARLAGEGVFPEGLSPPCLLRLLLFLML